MFEALFDSLCVCALHCALCIVYCALCIVHCVLCSVHCALCIVHCALCIVHCVLCIVYCVLYIVCFALCSCPPTAVTYRGLTLCLGRQGLISSLETMRQRTQEAITKVVNETGKRHLPDSNTSLPTAQHHFLSAPLLLLPKLLEHTPVRGVISALGIHALCHRSRPN